MPKYNSHFASPESIQEKWDLDNSEAKKVYELWDMAYDELLTTKDKDLLKLRKEAEGYLTQKPGVFDNPDPKLTRVKVSASSAQWTRLVNTYGVLALMRTLGMGGQDKQQTFHTVWSGIKGKEKGSADAAKRTAKKFNDIYAADEFLNYLRHLAGKDKNFSVQKPYVVPAGQDKFNLYVWYKK